MPLDPLHNDAVEIAVSKSLLKGAHNLKNAILAARLARAAGATLDGIIKGIANFKPLPHRLEEHKIGDLTVVNDSISTTPEATKAALKAYAGRKIALIAGGHERQQDYKELVSMLDETGVSLLLCLPKTGARLARNAMQAGINADIIQSETLESALHAARKRQNEFNTLILSPGAPSYNQFDNFQERGRAFLALANSLLS